MIVFPANLIPDGDTFVVLFPDLPHAHTNGRSVEDAVAHAPDALVAGLSMLMEKNLPIPSPGKKRGKSAILVTVPSVVVNAKIELYKALRTYGVKKAELARRMGIHKQQVERLLDLSHASRIEQLEGAFAALELQMVVDVRTAA